MSASFSMNTRVPYIIGGRQVYVQIRDKVAVSAYTLYRDKEIAEMAIQNIASFLINNLPSDMDATHVLREVKSYPINNEKVKSFLILMENLQLVRVLPNELDEDPTDARTLITLEREVSITDQRFLVRLGREHQPILKEQEQTLIKAIAISTQAFHALKRHARALERVERLRATYYVPAPRLEHRHVYRGHDCCSCTLL